MKRKKLSPEAKKKLSDAINRSLIIILIVVGIMITAYGILRMCGFTTAEDLARLRNDLGDSWMFWGVISLLLVIQALFIPISSQFIIVPLTVMFPPNEAWKVWISAWAGSWIATLIQYLIGRTGGRKLLQWVLSDEEQVKKCGDFLRKGWFFYPLGMLLPLPDEIVTVLAGTSKINAWFVIGCSFVTRAIDTACSVYGLGVLTKYWWGWIVLAVAFILLGLVSWLGYKITKNLVIIIKNLIKF